MDLFKRWMKFTKPRWTGIVEKAFLQYHLLLSDVFARSCRLMALDRFTFAKSGWRTFHIPEAVSTSEIRSSSLDLHAILSCRSSRGMGRLWPTKIDAGDELPFVIPISHHRGKYKYRRPPPNPRGDSEIRWLFRKLFGDLRFRRRFWCKWMLPIACTKKQIRCWSKREIWLWHSSSARLTDANVYFLSSFATFEKSRQLGTFSGANGRTFILHWSSAPVKTPWFRQW
jgi:hypothetical protein